MEKEKRAQKKTGKDEIKKIPSMRSPDFRTLSVDKTDEKYQKKLDGVVTAAISHINKKTTHRKTDDGQGWLFDVESLSALDGCVELKDPESNELNFAASQLTDIIALDLTNKVPYGISDDKLTKFLDYSLDVESYMSYRGVIDKNQAVKQLKKDLCVLFNASIKATIKRHVKEDGRDKVITERQEIRIIDERPDGEIRKSAHIHVALSFARYLMHSQVMAYPLKILVSTKNHNVYYIGRKLAEYYNVNRTKRQKNCISVEKLLESTPEIPTLKEEKQGKKNYRNRCIEPLEKALCALQDVGIISKWHFMDKGRKEIQIDDLTKYGTGYDEWCQRFVFFELKDYPDYISEKEKKYLGN